MSNFIFTNQFYNDDKGRTLPKARLYFYDNNTFNFTDVYSDPALTQVLDNPVTADGAGRFPQIFMDISKTYRVWLKDRNDVQVTPYIDDYSPSASSDLIFNSKADTFADLRTIEPVFENQVITLIGHTVAGVGGGTFRAVLDASGLTDDNGVTAVTTGGAGWIRELSGFVSPQMYGAIANGVTDNTTEIQSAHNSGFPVIYEGGQYVNTRDGSSQVFIVRGEVGGEKQQLGEWLNPTDNNAPVLICEKFSSANRDINAGEWDAGGAMFNLHKRAGDAFGVAITGYAMAYGGEGDWVGGHFRSRGTIAVDAGVTGNSVFGSWVVSIADPTGGAGYMAGAVGQEINLQNNGDNLSKTRPANVGLYRGHVIKATEGVSSIGCDIITDNTNGYWLTGIRVRADSILPYTNHDAGTTSTEALQIDGGTTTTNRYDVLNANNGYYNYLINTDGGDYQSDKVVVFGDGHKLLWGKDSIKYVNVDSSLDANLMNFSGYNIGINSTKILGSRKTGWGTPSGTSDKTTFATSTVTTEQLAERVKALIDDLRSHGLIGN